ncbi:MAG: hypothetical protein MAG431_02208 [Chloroflexi bacterium]|nr:hypothetical protein [Chloroflexota bacterium]
MPTVISSSELRTGIKQVLNEVGYGQKQYIVERFGEPTAAVISIKDLRLLQAVKEQQADTTLKDTVASIQARTKDLDANELNSLVEEARSEFYDLENKTSHE